VVSRDPETSSRSVWEPSFLLEKVYRHLSICSMLLYHQKVFQHDTVLNNYGEKEKKKKKEKPEPHLEFLTALHICE